MSGSYPKATDTKFPGLDHMNLLEKLFLKEKKRKFFLDDSDESQAWESLRSIWKVNYLFSCPWLFSQTDFSEFLFQE